MASARAGRLAGRGLLLTPFLFLAVFFLAPLVMTFVWSVWRQTGFWMEPALDTGSYSDFFGGPRVGILRTSLGVAAGVTFLSLLVAYPIAYSIAKASRWRTQIVLLLFAFPFLINYIIRNVALVYLLNRNGPVNSTLMVLGIVDAPIDWFLYSNFAVWLGLFSAYMPLMVFPLWVSIAGIDQRLIEASWVLGASPRTTLWSIVVPLSMPGVFAALTLTFVASFGESAVSSILGGSGYQLIGNTITSSMNALNYPLAAAISSVVVLIMMVLLSVWFGLFKAESLLGKVAGWGS